MQVIAFGGRDCSVQRRHQKIIEEGPPTAASPSVFRSMENSAIALAKMVLFYVIYKSNPYLIIILSLGGL
jgi:acetyl/propionyl-CoA carboxylase alpha subunit